MKACLVVVTRHSRAHGLCQPPVPCFRTPPPPPPPLRPPFGFGFRCRAVALGGQEAPPQAQVRASCRWRVRQTAGSGRACRRLCCAGPLLLLLLVRGCDACPLAAALCMVVRALACMPVPCSPTLFLACRSRSRCVWRRTHVRTVHLEHTHAGRAAPSPPPSPLPCRTPGPTKKKTRRRPPPATCPGRRPNRAMPPSSSSRTSSSRTSSSRTSSSGSGRRSSSSSRRRRGGRIRSGRPSSTRRRC